MSVSLKSKVTVLQESQENIAEEELNLSDNEGSYIDGIYIPPPIKPVELFDTSSKRRLIITKITNNFFKSYAGGETLGPFSKCFNAIIGPNGSGKSNVIDSMLFVFGYRASKIRSKKVSVLLHNSEKFNNVMSATVQIHFAIIDDGEGDEYEIVPGSEFVVSRTALKDNTSYYTLNDRRVQFKEVAVLLKGHGIDLDHNRFLILQGEVEQISMMKCKAEDPHEPGMLEYLEDIIGTTRYIKPLKQLSERVDVLTESKSEKLNRLKLVQNELDELKPAMEEAVDFLKTENIVVVHKNILYQKHLFDLEDELIATEEDKKTIEGDRNEILEKKEAIIVEKNEKETTLNTESTKFNNLSKRKAKLKEAFDEASNRDLELQAEMERLNKLRKKNISLLAEEKHKLVQYEKAPEESEKGIEECVKKEESLMKKKENFEIEKTNLLSKIKLDIQPLQEKKESLETELIPLLKVVEETKSAFMLTKSELEICTNNEKTENDKYENLKGTYENSAKLLKERQQQVQMLTKKIPPTEKSLNNATSELNSIKQSANNLKYEINKKRSSLEESRSSMQQSKSKSVVLESLMQQKREGNCPGLFGRLGDLGAVDLKYDVAVSTACGPLDSIVVDTVETGQWCIEFLRQNNVGRASFIPLEKQEHLREYANSTIQTPENVPRLFDLIKVQDDRVRTAFYFALGDTLVADELDQASRIAYGRKRYRVVTLKGELIETTGTMSGGGNKASRGRIGQSVTVNTINPRDLEELENEIRRMENEFKSIRDKEVRLEAQINVLEPELRQMKIDCEKYSSEMKSLTQQQPNLLKQLKAQEEKAKNTKSDAAQVKNLSNLLQKRESAFNKAKENANTLQMQVDRISEEIKEKSTAKVKTIDKGIAEIVKNINKLKTEITRLKVSSKTAERNVKKTTQNIANLEKEISSSENKLREMKLQREEIESDGEKLLTCIKEIEDELTSGGNDFSEMKQKVEELKVQLNKLKSLEVDTDRKLKTVLGKIAEIKSNMHQDNVKISQLKLQAIPDVQMEELKEYSKEEMEEQNIAAIERDLKIAEKKLTTMKPNLNVIRDYNKKMDVYMERMKQLEEISQKRHEMKDLYTKLHEQRKQEFLGGFNLIRVKLKELYQMITLGGDADFELVDAFDPFTEGIQLNVRPPKKSWKKISNLSGGEKTLSSLALVFALHYYKPSPLYIMDEIDAALDFKNVSIVGHYIKERTKNAQFLIISLRSQMFELCDNLVGIYKIFNCTKSVTIDPRVYDDSREEREGQVIPNINNSQEEIMENSEPPAKVVETTNDSPTEIMEASSSQLQGELEEDIELNTNNPQDDIMEETEPQLSQEF